MNTVTYYRTSTKNQSIEHQRYSAKKWASEKDLKILSEFKDIAVNGKSKLTRRSGFRELLEYLQNNKIDKILVFEVSRLCRSTEVAEEIVNLCERFGCSIEVVGLGNQDKESILKYANAADIEVAAMSSRTKSGVARLQKLGKRWGMKKGVSLGKPKKRKTYPKELVEAIRKYSEKGETCRAIAKYLSIDFGDKFSDSPITNPTVLRIMRRNGIVKRKKT